MSDDPLLPPAELVSIEGRARIVDATGNPIDPDNPPWGAATVQSPERIAPSNEMAASEPEPDDDEPPEDHIGKHHARAVHGRRSRTSK